MDEMRAVAQKGLDSLLKNGAAKAQCSVTLTDRHEMNVDSGELSLLRTTFDTRVNMTAIRDGKKGASSGNKMDAASVEAAAAEALSIAEASGPDDANDIAGAQPPARHEAGPESPDLDAMHRRLTELLDNVRTRHPKAIIMQAILDFCRARTCFVNSNGVDLGSEHGIYHLDLMFASRDGNKVSSFNGASVSLKDLGRSLIECASVDTVLRQSGEQVETAPVQGKFVGDIIITPDCLGDMLWFLFYSLSDGPMITGTSIYKDSLGKEIASPLLTVHSRPVSPEICDGYFITPDGYVAQDSTILDRGVLQGFLLSQYGARKTGRERAVNIGDATVVGSGDTPFDEMVRSVKKGLLLARFSGGMPSDNGDFSGVAKNSYFIEDGKIRYPVSETMVSGNFAEMLRNIRAVSRERVDFGRAILPYVTASGVTVSGK